MRKAVMVGALALLGCEKSGGNVIPCSTAAECPPQQVCQIQAPVGGNPGGGNGGTGGNGGNGGTFGDAFTGGTAGGGGDASEGEPASRGWDPGKADGVAKPGYCVLPAGSGGALGGSGGTGGIGGADGTGGTGGTGGIGGTGGCQDLSGVWSVTNNDCFPAGELGTVSQSGCSLTITSPSATITNATMTASTLGFTVTVTSSRGTANYVCATTLTSASAASGQCSVSFDGSMCSLTLAKQ